MSYWREEFVLYANGNYLRYLGKRGLYFIPNFWKTVVLRIVWRAEL